MKLKNALTIHWSGESSQANRGRSQISPEGQVSSPVLEHGHLQAQVAWGQETRPKAQAGWGVPEMALQKGGMPAVDYSLRVKVTPSKTAPSSRSTENDLSLTLGYVEREEKHIFNAAQLHNVLVPQMQSESNPERVLRQIRLRGSPKNSQPELFRVVNICHMIQQSHSWACISRKVKIQKNTCTAMFRAALFTIAKRRKQPKCPWTDD